MRNHYYDEYGVHTDNENCAFSEKFTHDVFSKQVFGQNISKCDV